MFGRKEGQCLRFVFIDLTLARARKACGHAILYFESGM